jgi:Kef-type K+ transport system membrane component KefB
LDHPRVGRSPFVLALGLCLGLAAVAESVGLAALVGAFLAGMVLAETNERYELDRRMQPLYDFLVPFFFVLAGAAMDPSRVVSGGWGFATVLIVVTLVAKLTGCGLAAVGLSWRERLQVGSAMVPRTEVTLVVAAAGAATGVLSTQVFAVLVAAALVTTLVTPAILRLAIPHERPAEEAGA